MTSYPKPCDCGSCLDLRNRITIAEVATRFPEAIEYYDRDVAPHENHICGPRFRMPLAERGYDLEVYFGHINNTSPHRWYGWIEAKKLWERGEP